MVSNDPVAAAIATKGVEDEASSLHSSQPHHSTILDDIVPKRDETKVAGGDYDDDQDDEDGPVVFDASDVQLASAQDSPQSARSASSANIARASFESVGFGYRDHLLPLSLSGDGDYDDDSTGYVAGSSGLGYGLPEGSMGARSRRSSGRGRRDERRMSLIDGERCYYHPSVAMQRSHKALLMRFIGIALTVGVQIVSHLEHQERRRSYSTLGERNLFVARRCDPQHGLSRVQLSRLARQWCLGLDRR